MERVCFIMEVYPGYEEEYKRRHDEIWPELENDIRMAGFRNYSIWRYGLLLIGYFESEDPDASLKKLGQSDHFERWNEYMKSIMKIEIDPNTGGPFRLPLIWRLHEPDED